MTDGLTDRRTCGVFGKLHFQYNEKDCDEPMCEACREAHTKTRLTKGHEVEAIKDAAFYHPVLDDQQGGRGEDQVEIANLQPA